MSDSDPITATLPVLRANSQAACTFGPMEPAAKPSFSISSGWAWAMAFWVGLPKSMKGVDVGGDHQQIAFQLFGQQRRAQVLVDHRFHALQLAVGVVHRRNAATAGADYDAAFFQQPFDRADLKDALGPGACDHPAELVAVRGDGPAFFSRQLLRLLLAVDRADGFGGVLEGRVVAIHFDLGQQRGEGDFEVQ